MASVTRSAKATWAGSNRQGRGTLSTESGTLSQTRYAFDSRFLDTIGTNPEELIAAAHAGCFNMSLAYRLGSAGYNPTLLTTTARVKLTQDTSGWHISRVDLVLEAVVPGINFEQFSAIAAEAKLGCAISRSIKAQITLTTSLAEASDQQTS